MPFHFVVFNLFRNGFDEKPLGPLIHSFNYFTKYIQISISIHIMGGNERIPLAKQVSNAFSLRLLIGQ